MLSVIQLYSYESIILLGPVAQSEASPAVHQGFVSSIPFLEIGHENRYTFIRYLPLIQEGFLSVSSESMCKKYCFIPLFHTGPDSYESPRIDKYLDSWLFAKILTESYSP